MPFDLKLPGKNGRMCAGHLQYFLGLVDVCFQLEHGDRTSPLGPYVPGRSNFTQGSASPLPTGHL